MRKKIWAIVMLSSIAGATVTDNMIANMFILGFYGTSVPKGSQIRNDICRKGLGGVILFDRDPLRHNKPKNISSAAQLKRLTTQLSSCSHKPLIAVDQEGGLVQRIRFGGIYPKASHIANKGRKYAFGIFGKMASELHSLKINYDFAPVADLSINPSNKVIVRNGRSFGKDVNTVVTFDRIFIDRMHRYGVLTALKHFPGHGSSLGDTHKGFVDVSDQWTEGELEPYRKLIKSNMVDSIMVAHIFNRHLDTVYPASLSRYTVHTLLRGKLHYKGTIITDDLQMRAISKHYSLEKTITKAINAGNDILLFGNQLAKGKNVNISQLTKIVRKQLSRGAIDPRSIIAANRRISAMRHKIGLGR